MKTIHERNEKIMIRPAQERGHGQYGWLDSYHTFSFADYYDERHEGFRSLRVINEDRVQPGKGFATHPHKDMEILTYVISGSLEHKDSMGNGSVINFGDVQKMSAGTGITHSEFNPSQDRLVHLLQIWILPKLRGIKPAYEQFTLPALLAKDPLVLIGSPDGAKNVAQFHQDILIFRGILRAQKRCYYHVKPDGGVWVQMIKGSLWLDDHLLNAGDGASVENTNKLELTAENDTEFLLFDMN